MTPTFNGALTMSKGCLLFLSSVLAMLVLASSDAMAQDTTCRGGAVSGTPSCPTGSSSSNGSTGDTWGTQVGLAINQWFRRQLSGEARQDRANQLNHQAVQLSNSGDWAGAIPLYRQALAANQSADVIRLNLMFALYQQARRTYVTGNAASRAQVLSMLDEIAALDRSSLNGDAQHDELMRYVAISRADLQREADNERALAGASRNISGIARDLSTTIATDSRRRADAQQGGLVFGDPSATPNLNPGARTSGAQQAATGPARTPPPPVAGGTMGALQNAATGRSTIGETVDGGTAHDDNTEDPNTVRAAGSIQGRPVYTAEQIQTYSARSPAVREAQARYEHDHQAATEARARQRQLEAQAETTSDQSARQRIQIQIANNSQVLANAEAAEHIAENARNEAIQVLIQQGDARVIEDEAPATSREGRRQ